MKAAPSPVVSPTLSPCSRRPGLYWKVPSDARPADVSPVSTHVVRDAAKATASDLGVDIGDINGRAIVLAVAGHWHELLAPGLAVCSVSDAADPRAAAAILRKAFSSWVTR